MPGLDVDTLETDQQPQQVTPVSAMDLGGSEWEVTGSVSDITTNQYIVEGNMNSESSGEVVLDILNDLVDDVVNVPKADSRQVPKVCNPRPKIYCCEKCGKFFSQFKSLQKHKQLCTGLKKEAFVCEQCKQSLSDKRSLRRHIESLHKP